MKAMIPVYDKYDSDTLDYQTQAWIKSTLSNDENSSDQELVEYFMQEGPMPQEEAELWVSRRQFYMNNIVRDTHI